MDENQQNILIMDNIVDQLRYWSNKWFPQEEHGQETTAGSLLNKAADEIERLRAQLQNEQNS